MNDAPNNTARFLQVGKEIGIPTDDPFQNDCQDRQSDIKMLSNLLATTSKPMVIAVDAPWGGGKTTFIRMWGEWMRGQGHTVAMYNAWSNDYCSDPFIAFMSEIDIAMSFLKENSKTKKAWQTVRKVGSKVVTRILPLAAQMGTMGIVKASDVGEISKELSEVAAEGVSKWVDEGIKEYQAQQKTRQQFTEKLREFTKSLEEDGKKLPLVLFVDELDRCSPSIAVLLLERLQHLFAVPGIAFVLALDKGQLRHTVEALYGNNFDGEGYLRRFFDLDYRLPSIPTTRFVKDIYAKLSMDECFPADPSEGSTIVELMEVLNTPFRTSLRDQIQILQRINLALRVAPGDRYHHHMLLSFLVWLRHFNRSLYDKFMDGGADGQELIDELEKLDGWSGHIKDIPILRGRIIAATRNKENRQKLINDLQVEANGQHDREKDRMRATHTVDVARDYTQKFQENDDLLLTLRKRIEITDLLKGR